MKKLTKLLIIPVIAFSLVGCGKVPVLENGQEAVATTNKGSISAEDLYEKLKTTYGNNVLIDLIDKLILNEKYEETEDEKEYIKEQIKQIKSAATSNGMTFETYINYYGFKNEEAVEEYLVLNYRRDLAVKDYIKSTIKEKEINKYYEENIYGDIRVKHILIEPETLTGMTSEEIEQAKAKALKTAKEVINKLKNGKKFDTLAKEYSDDKSNNENGGDLGWFNTGEMEESFEKAAFALKKGSYTTTPVETKYGYHIIYKTDEKEKPKLEDVKAEILNKLVEEKLTKDSTLYYKALENIRKEADLKIEDSFLKDAYNDYMKQLKSSK
ncbi:MAG: peptidylprolyl isomerase [bacterium]|nr:peptidylprolyl isomerase [bacterium]